jgi:hypothetical protein
MTSISSSAIFSSGSPFFHASLASPSSMKAKSSFFGMSSGLL